jgi:hypothetical protein
MKKYIPIILSLTFVGCTTGSKTKINTNYYSNVSYTPEPVTIYKEVPVEVPVYKTIYKKVPPREATMGDLGQEIGRKMLRKIYAAYNET